MPLTGSEEHKARRVEWAFENKFGGNSAHTKLFSAFDQSTQAKILTSAQLDSGEIPMIGYFVDPDHWFLATSRRVCFVNESKQITKLTYQNIRSMGPASKDATWKSSPEFIFEDHAGVCYEAQLEPGTGLTAVWNCLMLKRRLDKAHSRP